LLQDVVFSLELKEASGGKEIHYIPDLSVYQVLPYSTSIPNQVPVSVAMATNLFYN
jgi:hypothetical protein